jgi:hypothetical protein
MAFRLVETMLHPLAGDGGGEVGVHRALLVVRHPGVREVRAVWFRAGQ